MKKLSTYVAGIVLVLPVLAHGQNNLSDATNIINDTDDEYTGRTLTESKSISKQLKDALEKHNAEIGTQRGKLKQLRDRLTGGGVGTHGPKLTRQELNDWRSSMSSVMTRLQQFQISYRAAFPGEKQPKKGERATLFVRYFNQLTLRTDLLADASYELADRTLALLKSGKADDLRSMMADTADILRSIAAEIREVRSSQESAIREIRNQ